MSGSYSILWDLVVDNFCPKLLHTVNYTGILFGLANSVNDVADSAYIAENSTSSIRGIVGSVSTHADLFRSSICGKYDCLNAAPQLRQSVFCAVPVHTK